MYFIDWKGVAYFFSPHKDLIYIAQKVHHQVLSMAQGDRQARSKHYTVTTILILALVQTLYLSVATFGTEWDHLVAGDTFYFLDLERNFAIMFGGLFFLIIYLHRIIEIKCYRYSIFQHLSDIIVFNRREFIFNFCKDFNRIGQILVKYVYQPAIALTSKLKNFVLIDI